MPRNVPGSAKMPRNENLPDERASCAFCPKPERKTEWFHEDAVCLIINKPTGEPMVVLKRHTTEPTDKEAAHIERLVSRICGDHELQEIMAHVPNHYHLHIIDYDRHPEEVLDEV